MRTVNATLQAALDAGGFNAYIKARVKRLAFDQTYDVLSYKLTGTMLHIQLEGQVPSGDPGVPATIELIRGATVAGVDYTISTSKFIVVSGTNQKVAGAYHRADIQAHLINPIYMSFLADGSYEAAISSFCTALGKTYTLRDPSATFWTNQFLPTGKNFTANSAQAFLTMLRQKYFIFACDNGSEDILFYSGMQTPNEDYIITPQNFYYVDAGYKPKRRFFAKDESDIIRYSGTAGDTLHNLGFIHSSDSLPTRYEQEQSIAPYPIAPQFYPQDGDSILFDEILLYPAKITESFNPHLPAIPWRTEIEQERLFTSAEGGSDPWLYPSYRTQGKTKGTYYTMPEIEQTRETDKYTPLYTGTFAGKLSTTDNNVQAAFETLDTHTHTAEQIGAIPNDGWEARAETWTRTGNHTFTISGDVTAIYEKGTKIRYKDGGSYEYGVVLSSSVAAGTTTVNLIVNSDYAMANTTITGKYVSYTENPVGFPDYFAYTTTWATSGTQPAIGNGSISAKWKVKDKEISFQIYVTMGSTSTFGTGNWTFSLPADATSSSTGYEIGVVYALDFGTMNYYGFWYLASGTNLISCLRDNTTQPFNNNTPHTWATNDILSIKGFYEY